VCAFFREEEGRSGRKKIPAERRRFAGAAKWESDTGCSRRRVSKCHETVMRWEEVSVGRRRSVEIFGVPASPDGMKRLGPIVRAGRALHRGPSAFFITRLQGRRMRDGSESIPESSNANTVGVFSIRNEAQHAEGVEQIFLNATDQIS